VEGDEIAEAVHRKGDADGDADRSDGEELDGAFHPHGAEGTEAFQGREADHLGLVEKELAGGTLAGVHLELGDGLAEQLMDGTAGGVVSHVEGIDVNGFAGIPGRLERLAHGVM
jgi:hypothetical protein